ncbi:ElyC/SanA/YdcF family protein [Shewanella olleyana]|uniref:ElyC/SanA/YdcF family protein n=1 Tax=Shewanella olleyana TaxID=135626 RepID=UPI0031FF3BBE
MKLMFWFKKGLSQFVMPVPFILICLLFALFIWRFQAKKLKSFGQFSLLLGISSLMLLSNSFISANLANSLESQYPVNELPLTQINDDACYVMVLGSGHRENDEISAVQQLSSTALTRLSEGLRQLRLADNQCTLVVSGWSGGLTPTPHAFIMKQAAIELGVTEQSIVTFPEALDTIEEAQSMKTLVGKTPFILVTSATHMPRSMMIFTANKLSPVAAPTNFLSSPGYWWRFSAENLFISQRSIHEYVGMLWIKIKGFITNV